MNIAALTLPALNMPALNRFTWRPASTRLPGAAANAAASRFGAKDLYHLHFSRPIRDGQLVVEGDEFSGGTITYDAREGAVQAAEMLARTHQSLDNPDYFRVFRRVHDNSMAYDHNGDVVIVSGDDLNDNGPTNIVQAMRGATDHGHFDVEAEIETVQHGLDLGPEAATISPNSHVWTFHTSIHIDP